jgi:hypothetical protein
MIRATIVNNVLQFTNAGIVINKLGLIFEQYNAIIILGIGFTICSDSYTQLERKKTPGAIFTIGTRHYLPELSDRSGR